MVGGIPEAKILLNEIHQLRMNLPGGAVATEGELDKKPSFKIIVLL
jgi:hypothetical protein